MQKTIYLVEDDEGIREMLGYVLSTSYNLRSFETLKAFNAGMQASLPDLVIMDIMLPDGNGDEAGLALGNSEATKNIPVLFMSANMKFTLAGPLTAYDFINKPFDIRLLREKVNALLMNDA